MKPPKSKMAELAHNATGGEKSRAEAAESAEFTMTELGPIPVDWEVKRIGEVGKLMRDSVNTQVFPDQTYYEYSMPNYDDGRIPRVVLGRSLFSNKTSIQGEVLLFNKLNVRKRRIWYVKEALPNAICSSEFLPYYSKEIDLCFLSYFLSTDKCTSAFEDYSTGTSNSQKRIAPLDFENYTIPLPPIAEQRRIAEALSDVDELISALGKLIEKKRNIKTGAMQQLLTGKTRLPGFGAKRTEFKQTELGPIPVDWEVKRLGNIADFVTSTVSTLLIEGAWYIGTENMLANGGGIVQNEGQIPYQSVREYLIGDILISNIRPYLKKIWLADRNGGCSTDVIVIRIADHNECLPEYIKMLLSCDAFFDYVMANAVGTKMPRGDKKVIVDYEFPLPPLAEQKAIAGVLSDMDAEIAALEADRAKYERIKQGMMQELLTGKTRLKGE